MDAVEVKLSYDDNWFSLQVKAKTGTRALKHKASRSTSYKFGKESFNKYGIYSFPVEDRWKTAPESLGKKLWEACWNDGWR